MRVKVTRKTLIAPTNKHLNLYDGVRKFQGYVTLGTPFCMPEVFTRVKPVTGSVL